MKSHVFGLSSTVVRPKSSKIFPVDAVTLLHVIACCELGASRCRFNVSTAFRGSRLHSNQRVIIIIFWLQRCPVPNVSGRVQQDRAKVDLGSPLVTAESRTIMPVSYIPRFRKGQTWRKRTQRYGCLQPTENFDARCKVFPACNDQKKRFYVDCLRFNDAIQECAAAFVSRLDSGDLLVLH